MARGHCIPYSVTLKVNLRNCFYKNRAVSLGMCPSTSPGKIYLVPPNFWWCQMTFGCDSIPPPSSSRTCLLFGGLTFSGYFDRPYYPMLGGGNPCLLRKSLVQHQLSPPVYHFDVSKMHTCLSPGSKPCAWHMACHEIATCLIFMGCKYDNNGRPPPLCKIHKVW